MHTICRSKRALLLLTTSMLAFAVLSIVPSSFRKVVLPLRAAEAVCAANDYRLDDADPNEPTDVIKAYWAGIDLIGEGRWDHAQSWFENSLSQYPDSRHLHAGLAQVFWYLAVDGPQDSANLELAAREIVKAAELGFRHSKVRHTWLLAQVLGRTGDRATLNQLFEQALEIDPAFEVYLNYSLGLRLLSEKKAEKYLQRAVELQPEGNVDALAYYGEWLLDLGREDDVIMIIPEDTHFEYLHFLRGVALERMKRPDEAKAEYVQYVSHSAEFPAPSRYRIPSSTIQQDIHFEGDLMLRATTAQALTGLSALIYGEAGGESNGAQRAAGWVVRNRVLRGSVGGCPSVDNSGSTLADKYGSVMCQSGQYDGMCPAWCGDPSTTACSHSVTTDHNAYDVYYGYAPDPVKSGGYCPSGYDAGTCPDGVCEPCWSVVHCWGSTSGYSTQGGVFNYGASGSCPVEYSGSDCPPTSRGKTCGDGGPDNCFYTNP